MAKRRKGSGSLFRRADGRWIGRMTIPSEPGQVVRKQILATRFCDALRKFSDMHPYQPEFSQPATPRVEAMRAARELGRHTAGEWWALVRSVSRACLYCGVETSVRGGRYGMTKDHKVPVSRGGSDAIDNIAVSCRKCNSAKCDMTADEFITWGGPR